MPGDEVTQSSAGKKVSEPAQTYAEDGHPGLRVTRACALLLLLLPDFMLIVLCINAHRNGDRQASWFGLARGKGFSIHLVGKHAPGGSEVRACGLPVLRDIGNCFT